MREDLGLRLHRLYASEITSRYKIHRSKIVGNIIHMRNHVHGAPTLSLVAQWEELLFNDDVDAMVNICLSSDSHAHDMRQVSPLGAIVTDAQRQKVIFDEG